MADASSFCSVCLRSLSLTSAGLIRAHGPISSRCLGSGKLPRPAIQVDGS